MCESTAVNINGNVFYLKFYLLFMYKNNCILNLYPKRSIYFYSLYFPCRCLNYLWTKLGYFSPFIICVLLVYFPCFLLREWVWPQKVLYLAMFWGITLVMYIQGTVCNVGDQNYVSYVQGKHLNSYTSLQPLILL